MIYKMKNSEIRDSGIISSNTFQWIRQLYSISPEKAGEFAISAIESALTGEISSDDAIIKVMLNSINVINKET